MSVSHPPLSHWYSDPCVPATSRPQSEVVSLLRRQPLILLALLAVFGTAVYCAEKFFPPVNAAAAASSVSRGTHSPLAGVYEMVSAESGSSILGRTMNGQLVEFFRQNNAILSQVLSVETTEIRDGGRLEDEPGQDPVYIVPGQTEGYVVKVSARAHLRKLATPLDLTASATALTDGRSTAIVCCVDERTSERVGRIVSQVHEVCLETGRVLSELTIPDVVYDAAWDPHTQTCYLAQPGGVYVWQRHAAALKRIWQQSTRSLQISSQQRILVVGQFNGNVSGISLESGEEVWLSYAGRESAVKNLLLSPVDSDLIAVAGEFGYVLLLEVRTGREVMVLRQQAPAVNGIAFSADGHTLFVCTSQAEMTAWDLSRRRCVSSLWL